MPRPLDLTIWYEALGSAHGVVIEVDNVEKDKALLYRLRESACDPDLMSISIVTSPEQPDKHLWLVKRNEA